MNTAPFLNTREFAQTALLGGGPVVGVFDEAHAVGSVGPLGMGTSAPTLLLESAAVPADPVGVAVEVEGQRFVVADAQPDGTGFTLLILEAA